MESDGGPAEQDHPASKMAPGSHHLGLDRSLGKKSSRQSKRGVNTVAGGLVGQGENRERSGADKLPSAGTGPDGKQQRGAYHPAAAGLSQKKYLLKKNQFESDLGFPTGHFEDVGNLGDKTKEQFSKSANHAKVLRIINAASLVPASPAEAAPGLSRQTGRASGDSTTARALESGKPAGVEAASLPGGFNETQNEQEMRETSYFKQQTDDEGANAGGNSHRKMQPKRALLSQEQSDASLHQPTQQRVASLNELIHVSNPQNLQAQGPQKPQPATCKNQAKGPVMPAQAPARSHGGLLKNGQQVIMFPGGGNVRGAAHDYASNQDYEDASAQDGSHQMMVQ